MILPRRWYQGRKKEKTLTFVAIQRLHCCRFLRVRLVRYQQNSNSLNQNLLCANSNGVSNLNYRKFPYYNEKSKTIVKIRDYFKFFNIFGSISKRQTLYSEINEMNQHHKKFAVSFSYCLQVIVRQCNVHHYDGETLYYREDEI
jgi:hypothetical protein